MNSRDQMLKAVRAALPEPLPLPELFFPEKEPQAIDVQERFGAAVQATGGTLAVLDNRAELPGLLARHYDLGRPVWGQVPGLSLSNLPDEPDPHAYAHLHLCVVEGHLGVAENAAVWLPETAFALRALPFIAENLVIVLRAGRLVPTLHEALAWLQTQAFGYGTWLAGPSKTADIEQSLVIGAHGAKSLLVALERESE